MDGKNQIKSLTKDFCKDGYIENQQYELLIGLCKQFNIPASELDKIIDTELSSVKEKQLETIYKLLNQPHAAVLEKIDFYSEDVRKFPDLLNLGKLSMLINPEIESSALIPTGGISGICFLHDNDPTSPLRIIQNLSIRLALSIPPKKFKFTLIDVENSGLSFKYLSDLDENIYSIIDDNKDVEKFLETTRKDSTTIVFKELGNKYNSYSEYFKKNKAAVTGYKIILINELPSNPSTEVIASLQKLLKIAHNAGVFFLISMDKKYYNQNILIKDAINDHLFIYDFTDGMCKSNNKDIIKWYNLIYKTHPEVEIGFDEDIKHIINQEFDPIKYKGTPSSIKDLPWGEQTDENILIQLNSSSLSNIVNIFLNDNKEDLWIFTNDEDESNNLYVQIINDLVQRYSPNELQLSIYGGKNDLTESLLQLSHIKTIVESNNGVFLLGLIEDIENEIDKRNKCFAETGIQNVTYQEFRKNTNKSMPRIVVFINNLHVALKNSTDQFSNFLIDKFGKLINSCNQYGIHLIVSSEPIESLLLFDLSHFSYSILLNNKVEQAELFAHFSIDQVNIFNEAGRGLFINKTNDQYEEFEIDGNASDKLKKCISKIQNNTNNQLRTYPLLLGSGNIITHNDFPKLNNNISDDVSICFNIGKPNWFKPDENYSLTIPNQSDGNVLITGIDNDALTSLIKSAVIQLSEEVDITIFDFRNELHKTVIENNPVISGINEIGLYINKKISLDETNNLSPNIFGIEKKEKPSLLFITGIDSLFEDSNNKEIIKKISNLIELANDMNIHIVINTNNDSIFDEDNLGTLSKITFGTNIICKLTNDKILNPLITMDGKLSVPTDNYHVIIDTRLKQSNFSADPIILYVNN